MGTFLQDFGAGGGISLDFRHFLQGGLSGDPIVLIGYLGGDPQYCEDPQRIPPQVACSLEGMKPKQDMEGQW